MTRDTLDREQHHRQALFDISAGVPYIAPVAKPCSPASQIPLPITATSANVFKAISSKMGNTSVPALHPFFTPTAEEFARKLIFFQHKHSDKTCWECQHVSITHVIVYFMSRVVSATPALFYMRCLLGGKLLLGPFCVPYFFKGKQMALFQQLALKCCMSDCFTLVHDLF